MRRQLSRWGAAGVVALVVCALGPAGYSQSVAASSNASGASTAAAPRDGRIVAANLDTGQLETMNPDGSGRRTVTPPGEHGFQPAWSPDGSHIAFASDHAGPDPRIYTVRADGTGMQQVGDDPEGYVDNSPTYTPDGKRIMYTRCRPDPPGGCALYSMRTNGQDLHAVTPYDNGDRADFYPDVAADGRIAFVRFSDHGILAQVWVARADGSHAHAITTPQLEAGQPDWTHDGHHLLVTSAFAHFGENIYRVTDEGKQVTKLTSAPFPHNAQSAVMSPSGSRIVYADDQAYPQVIGADLIVMNPNGSGKHAIATETRLVDPDWGTAPLITSSSAQSLSSAPESATSRRAVTMPRWLAARYGQGSPTTSRWSR
jgi:Tol biopolymer transport system component